MGSDSLLYEIECIQIFDEVLSKLGLPGFTIKINNRKVLNGIAEVSGESDRLTDIVTAIDKLDKIGVEGVVEELNKRDISQSCIEMIKPLFGLKGTNKERLGQMSDFLADSEIGMKGLQELSFLFDIMKHTPIQKGRLEFDVCLARGLN